MQRVNQVIIIMGVHIGDNELVITTERETFHYCLPKDVANNLKDQIDFIIKHNERLAEKTTKNRIRQLLSKYNHVNDIYELKNQQNK